MDSVLTTEHLVQYAGKMAKWSLESGDNLIWYLKTLANFSDYSVNNQLLILGYNPTAQYIKGYDEWQEFGVIVNQDSTIIPIIEPVNDGYQIKYMLDYRDTNYSYTPMENDKLMCLEALLTNKDIGVSVVDEIKVGVRAMYIPEQNVILVKRSNQVSTDVFFTSIITEKVHAYFAKENEGVYKRSVNQFTATAVSYALGLKYEMNVDNIKLSNLPEKYTKLSETLAKKELDKITKAYNMINRDIKKNLQLIKERDVKIER